MRVSLEDSQTRSGIAFLASAEVFCGIARYKSLTQTPWHTQALAFSTGAIAQTTLTYISKDGCMEKPVGWFSPFLLYGLAVGLCRFKYAALSTASIGMFYLLTEGVLGALQENTVDKTEDTTEVSNPIKNWAECSICQQILDGNPLEDTHDGLVALSKRCYHVFHKTCIEEWLDRGKRTCPNCNLKHFSVCEIILNPEHTKQYQKWAANPNCYSYEKAFKQEYGKSSKEVGIVAEHILRPEELRGLGRRDRLTREEITQFYDEMSNVLMSIGAYATEEEIEKAREDFREASDLFYEMQEVESFRSDNFFEEIEMEEAYRTKSFGSVRGVSTTSRRRKANTFAQLYALRGLSLGHNAPGKLIERLESIRIDQQKTLDQCCRKVCVLRDKILNAEVEPSDEMRHVSDRLSEFLEEFRMSGQTHHSRTIEESRELLELVSVELDDFIHGLPMHIRTILRNTSSLEEDIGY